MILVLTCEHSGNIIPETYKKHFKNKAVLKTHRAYDLGAFDLFQSLEFLSDASYFSSTSRLLVELNRSVHHKNLFSEFTKDLSKSEKTNILKTYYLPYRTEVESGIRSYIENGNSVLHLSIHSFTPIFYGIARNCDIGLLYDSTKKQERKFGKALKSKLLKQDSNLNVRFNYPYLGKADGFTTYLRKQFPDNYLGIEIEVNQKFVLDDVLDRKMKTSLYKVIQTIKSKEA